MVVPFTEIGRVPERRWHISGERSAYSLLAIWILTYWFRFKVKMLRSQEVNCTNPYHRWEVLSRRMCLRVTAIQLGFKTIEQNDITQERVWVERWTENRTPLLATPVVDLEIVYYHISCCSGQMLRTYYCFTPCECLKAICDAYISP